MLNRIVIMGRLGRDPELRHTQGGVPVASFTLAVDRDFRDKTTGERATDWIDVVAWRQTGEFVSRYFTKGRMAVVEGRLQIRDWTDKEGNKRRNAEIVAENVYFGDSKREGDGGYQQGGYQSGGYQQGGYQQGGYRSGGYQQGGYDRPQMPHPADPDAGYGVPAADGDQFSEMTESESDLPF